MTVLRTDIEKALDGLISDEGGMRFQGFAVVLAKQKWPDLIACERKRDLGLDAHAPATLSADGDILEIDINERTISHIFANYLKSHFPGWNVDCEKRP